MSSLMERAHGAQPDRTPDRVPEGPTLRQQIQKMEDQFKLAMPKGMEAAQLVRDALTCLQQVPKLAECSPHTVLGALMSCAQLGLRPGVLGQAWILPYWDYKSRTNVATLVVGYKGFVELAYRSQQIASIVARTVYEGDTFEVEYGLDDRLIHKPAAWGEDRKPSAHYVVVKMTNGGVLFWVMTEPEMQAWKVKYAPKNRQGKIVGPWVSDYEAMARKTCLHRLAAWLPKSTELAYAMEVDNGVRTNLDPQVPPTTVTQHYEQVPPEDDGGPVDAEPVEYADPVVPDPHDGNDPWVTEDAQ